jgi:hypothetical protein
VYESASSSFRHARVVSNQHRFLHVLQAQDERPRIKSHTWCEIFSTGKCLDHCAGKIEPVGGTARSWMRWCCTTFAQGTRIRRTTRIRGRGGMCSCQCQCQTRRGAALCRTLVNCTLRSHINVTDARTTCLSPMLSWLWSSSNTRSSSNHSLCFGLLSSEPSLCHRDEHHSLPPRTIPVPDVATQHPSPHLTQPRPLVVAFTTS